MQRRDFLRVLGGIGAALALPYEPKKLYFFGGWAPAEEHGTGWLERASDGSRVAFDDLRNLRPDTYWIRGAVLLPSLTHIDGSHFTARTPESYLVAPPRSPIWITNSKFDMHG